MPPEPSEFNDGMYEDGSWSYLDRLHSHLDKSSLAWEAFFKRVLRPSQARIGGEFADHDKAEILFMDLAWRCTWPYVKGTGIDAWRTAFRRILARELSGRFPSPEERVDEWNQERKSSSLFAPPARRKDSPHPDQLVVNCTGDPNDDEVAAWRLELPWRAVVQARTLILDHRSRSRLDSGYVLA